VKTKKSPSDEREKRKKSLRTPEIVRESGLRLGGIHGTASNPTAARGQKNSAATAASQHGAQWILNPL
jgi:hypothetical protein